MPDKDKIKKQLTQEIADQRLQPRRHKVSQPIPAPNVADARDLTGTNVTGPHFDTEKESFRIMLEYAPIGVAMLDKDGTVIYLNRTFTELFGYSLDDIPDIHTWFEKVHPDPAIRLKHWNAFNKEMGKLVPAKMSRSLAIPFIRKDGTSGFAIYTGVLVGEGRLLFYCDDVTERQRTEERLVIQRDFAFALAATSSLEEALPICMNTALTLSNMNVGGIYVLDEASTIFTLACSAGVSAEFLEIFKQTNPDPLVPGLIPQVRTVYTYNDPGRSDPGSPIAGEHIKTVVYIPFIHDDRVIGYLLAGSRTLDVIPPRSSNILETIAAQTGAAIVRIRTRKALERSEQKYRDIFDNTIEGIFQITPENHFLSINPALAKISGFGSPQEMADYYSDTTIQSHVDPERRALLRRLVKEKGIVKDFETRIYTKDHSSTRWVSLNTRAVRDRDGQLIYYEGTMEDISKRKAAEEALQLSEEKFRLLAERSPVGIYILHNGITVYANPAFARIFGSTPEEIINRIGPKDHIHHDDLPEQMYREHRLISGISDVERMDMRGWDRDGNLIYLHGMGARMTYGGKLAIIGTLLDVTERKMAEENLRQKVTDLNTLHDASRILLREKDLDTIHSDICGLAVERFGARMAWIGIVHPGDVNVYPVASAGSGTEILGSVRVTRDNLRYGRGPVGVALSTLSPSTVHNIQKDKNYIPWRKKALGAGHRSVAAFPLVYGSDVLGVIVLTNEQEGYFTPDKIQTYQSFANIAAIAIANARLLHSVSTQRDEIRAMTARLADTQEAERKQLSRELHDQVGPKLAALGICLNVTRNLCSQDSGLTARFDDCLSLLNSMADTIRSVMGQLRPSLLDDYGLVSALRWYCTQFAQLFNIEASVSEQNSGDRLPPEVEIGMFRIAQEALNNVAKHSRAKRVQITIAGDRRKLSMTVSDDGIGFAPDKYNGVHTQKKGWGLTTMAERAEAIGGSCRIDSRPGQGTLVIVEVKR